MSTITITSTETINREFAQAGVHRLSERLNWQIKEKLAELVAQYEPETDNYINGELTIWVDVDIRVNHKEYGETK